MTLAEIYREEGKLQGIQQGIQEGETRALAKTAIRLLTKNLESFHKISGTKLRNWMQLLWI